MSEDKSVTVTLTQESFTPRKPKLWEIVSFCRRTGIVYKVSRGQDEDGPNMTMSIKGWRVSKYKWVDSIKLLWLKIRVKFNWI